MYLDGYSVRIVGWSERPSGYVKLPHGTKYKIALRNSLDSKCDAQITIDGEGVGTFRLAAFETMVLERPSYDEGEFTFFRADSREGRLADSSSVQHSDRGLLSVVFKPAQKPVYRETPKGLSDSWEGRTDSCFSDVVPGAAAYTLTSSPVPKNVSAGVTGLTGHSNQTFYSVPPLNYDYGGFRTIYLRLVCDESAIRPLKRSTSIPPPVR